MQEVLQQGGYGRGQGRAVVEVDCRGGVIVATNALGLGLDVGDVRLVVHVGIPRRLKDFV